MPTNRGLRYIVVYDEKVWTKMTRLFRCLFFLQAVLSSCAIVSMWVIMRSAGYFARYASEVLPPYITGTVCVFERKKQFIWYQGIWYE